MKLIRFQYCIAYKHKQIWQEMYFHVKNFDRECRKMSSVFHYYFHKLKFSLPVTDFFFVVMQSLFLTGWSVVRFLDTLSGGGETLR